MASRLPLLCIYQNHMALKQLPKKMLLWCGDSGGSHATCYGLPSLLKARLAKGIHAQSLWLGHGLIVALFCHSLFYAAQALIAYLGKPTVGIIHLLGLISISLPAFGTAVILSPQVGIFVAQPIVFGIALADAGPCLFRLIIFKAKLAQHQCGQRSESGLCSISGLRFASGFLVWRGCLKKSSTSNVFKIVQTRVKCSSLVIPSFGTQQL